MAMDARGLKLDQAVRRTGGVAARAAGAAQAVTGAAVLAFACAACTTWPIAPAPTFDCSVEDGYDFQSIETYEDTSSNPAAWFSYGDLTPGSVHTQQLSPAVSRLPTLPVEGDGICGSQRALVLVTAGHNDYGSGFGSYCLNNNYADNGAGSYPCTAQDGTGFEGISFWARDPALPLDSVPGQVITHYVVSDGLPEAGLPDGGLPPGSTIVDSGYYDASVLAIGTSQGPFTPTATTKGVTVYFDDKHSSNLALNFNMNAGTKPLISDPCILPPVQRTCSTTVDSNGYATTAGSGCVPLPRQCGNSFSRIITLTNQWQLYLLPFSDFNQDSFPNRAEEDVDPSTIFTFGMRFPKEAVAEVWISKLRFYRKKQ
jgi:hypothetical protein